MVQKLCSPRRIRLLHPCTFLFQTMAKCWTNRKQNKGVSCNCWSISFIFAVRILSVSGPLISVSDVLEAISDAQLKTSCCLEAARAAANSDNLDGVTSFVAAVASQLSLQSDANSLHDLLCTWISASQVALAAAVLPHVSDVSLQDGLSGSTALMLASEEGHDELVVALLDRGAPLEAADRQNRTALLRASQAGQVRAVRALLDWGADSQHRDAEGLTCRQLAEQNGRSEVLRLFIDSRSEEFHGGASNNAENVSDLIPDLQQQQQLSRELHDLLNRAGFTQDRAQCLQKMADFLQRTARILTGDNRQLTGSFAEGWGNSLVQVNGRTAADSDIDCTILLAAELQHLQGYCRCTADSDATKLVVTEGHAQMQTPAGSQPAVAVPACGARPAQDTCHAYPCCSDYGSNRLDKLQLDRNDLVHLVRATRPNATNELRVSFSFKERRIMQRLYTIQGQLFVVVKFIFKTLLPKILEIPGLKTYHAKTLVFFMLERHGTWNESKWHAKNLIKLIKESLGMMLDFLDSASSPDECMPHFFMENAPLYFKNAGMGGDFDLTKARIRAKLSEPRSDIRQVTDPLMHHLKPLESEDFYFHPLILLPLVPQVASRIESSSGKGEDAKLHELVNFYRTVHQCLAELLRSDWTDDDGAKVMGLLEHLRGKGWCRSAVQCLLAMAHLRLEDRAAAQTELRQLIDKPVQRSWDPSWLPRTVEVKDLLETLGLAAPASEWPFSLFSIGQQKPRQFLVPARPTWEWRLPADSDWTWRLCLAWSQLPQLPPGLPAFTVSLLTARISRPRSAHLYVNFRCLAWSLQAELLEDLDLDFDSWRSELETDPDLEELHALANYSGCREHVEFCLSQMETIRDERRVAMEKQDDERIEAVRRKLAAGLI